MAGTLESEEEETLPPTAEELEELRKDQLNITLDVLHPGTRRLQNRFSLLRRGSRRMNTRVGTARGSQAKPRADVASPRVPRWRVSPGGARAEKGEVVCIHYSCYLEATGQLVESSRTNRHRPFEFVLGFGQVG
jgi:hypothetical protein